MKKWIISLTVGLAGWGLAAWFGKFIGSQMENHDLGIIMTLLISFGGGMVAGALTAKIYFSLDQRSSK